MSDESQPDDAYSRALALSNRKEYAAAFAAIQEALTQGDERRNVHNLAGFILMSLNALPLLPPALLLFERSLELWPDHTIALENLGNALVRLGQVDLALARLEEESRGRRRVAATRAWARLLVRLRRFEEAVAKFKDVVGDDFSLHVELGQAQIANGELREATEALTTVVQTYGVTPKARRLLAETQLELGWLRTALIGASVALEAAETDEDKATFTGIRDAAAAQLHAAGIAVPQQLDGLAFEVAAEDEPPADWAFRRDDPDINAARTAFREGRHEDAIAGARAALRVPNRWPTVILELAEWAGRRARVAGDLERTTVWKELERDAAAEWVGWSENGGEADSRRVYLEQIEKQLTKLRRKA